MKPVLGFSPSRASLGGHRSIYLRGCSAVLVATVRLLMVVVVGLSIAALVFLLAAY